MTEDADGNQYHYDLDNRIFKIDMHQGATVEFLYDALSRRVQRKQGSTKTAYLWWGDQECSEHKHQAGQATIQNDLWAHPTRLNTIVARAVDGSKFKMEWYHKNYLDHVYAVSSDSGNILEHYRYSAFGIVEFYTPAGVQLTGSQIANPVLWNSRRYDEATKLHYYKYRHYSPKLGRWPSRDPIGESGGLNLYNFLGNRPLGFVDYMGLSAQVVLVGDFSGDPGDAASKAELTKSIFDGIADTSKLILALTNMSDEDFKKKAKNGIEFHWYLEANGKFKQEARIDKHNVTRMELINMLNLEKKSNIMTLQEGKELSIDKIAGVAASMEGSPDYNYDSFSLQIHGKVHEGVRLGDIAQIRRGGKPDFSDAFDILNKVNNFESKALASCGANDGKLVKGSIRFIPYTWDQVGACKIIFTPLQAGFDTDDDAVEQ